MRPYKEPKMSNIIVEVVAYGVAGVLLIGAIVAFGIFLASIIPVDHIIEAECEQWEYEVREYPKAFQIASEEEVERMNEQCSDYNITF